MQELTLESLAARVAALERKIAMERLLSLASTPIDHEVFQSFHEECRKMREADLEEVRAEFGDEEDECFIR